MTILRRILKFTPAVVLGLLVVAWVVSVGREFGIDFQAPQRGRYIAGFENGTFYFGYNSMAFSRVYFLDEEDHANTSWGQGRLESDLAYHPDGTMWRWWFDCPIAVMLGGLLPLAIGPFTGFRFRLWHYLAYTALIAVELAYYLQWQA